MFKLSRRLSIIRASLIGCLVVAVLSTAGYFIINQHQNTNATQDGERVDVTYEDGESYRLKYGTGPGKEQGTTGSYTRRYQVVTSTGTYDSYCAQPRQDNPSNDEFEAILLSGNGQYENRYAMKLIMYVEKYGADSATENLIFGSVPDDPVWGTNRANRRFAFTHALIGYIYGDNKDTTGLSGEETEFIKDKVEVLKEMVTAQTSTWQAASKYRLFRTKALNDTDKKKQDVVWLEPTGSIIVKKCDAELYNLNNDNCTAQSDPNALAGITFTLKKGNTVIETKTLTGSTNQIVFNDLDLGETYTIVEGNNNNSIYNVTATSQTKTLPASITTPQTQTAIFTNTIKKGKLTVYKKDKDTGACPTITNGLSLTGIKFSLYNASASSIVYGNVAKSPNSLVAEKTLDSDSSCSVTFDNLPYGTYKLKETIPDSLKGWVKDETEKTITIHPANNGDLVTYNFENQPIRGDIRFVKKDSTNGTPMANAVFEISSISSNYTENHIVVADANGVVDTRDSVNPHRNHTNGYDELYYSSEAPIAYAGYGTWFGLKNNGDPISAKEGVGALPYGTYLIQELKCDTNMFCTNLSNEKKTFSITTNGQLVNLNDAGSDSWGNNCAEFSVETVATDNADGDKYLEAGEDTVIKDTVNYCAKSGYTYTITGTLMDQSTGNPLLINGEPITQSVTIPSDADDCGVVEMLFPVNTSELAGKSVVVFERLYYKNEIKASHEDINDPAQTIDIVSLGTIAVDKADDDDLIIFGEEAEIKDTVSYCAKKNVPYKITGILMDKTTGEPITIDGETLTQSIEFTPEEDCGTVELIFPIDTSKLTARPIVAYETLYKVTPGEPDTPVISHEDPEDEDQTVYIINLSTTVQPDEDGDKVFLRDSDVTVTDRVHYCLKPGLEYTVKGVVMDKSTGNGLLVDSKPVEQSVTFTPTETCGELDMFYGFNTTGLGGAQLVIFESLYLNGELILEHKDIENELESFEIDLNPPETGYFTKRGSGSQESTHQELLIIAGIAIAPVIVYTVNRRQARKRFLSK